MVPSRFCGGVGGSGEGSGGPWGGAEEDSDPPYRLPDPRQVVVDLAVDPRLPRLPAGVVTPRDDALQDPVADERSPRVTLGTKGTMTGPRPRSPAREDARGHRWGQPLSGPRDVGARWPRWGDGDPGDVAKGQRSHLEGHETKGTRFRVVATGRGDISKPRGPKARGRGRWVRRDGT